MRRIGMFLAIAVAFIAGTFVPSGHTQDQITGHLVTVHYLKVKPGKREDYLRMERNLWKPAHELLVKGKKMQSWAVYEVKAIPSPTGGRTAGVTADYDFVTFTVHDESQDYGKYEETALMSVHPDKTIPAITQRTTETRDTVKRELWTLVEQAR